jgi:DNA-binding PadR family transcriptional regulator
MADTTPIEKLDCILAFLNSDNEYQHSVKNVTDSISIKLNSPEVHKVLDKLVKDGYAEMRNVPYEKPIVKEETVKTSEYTYIITFEGQLFLQKGGYRQQEIDNNLHRASLETLESIRRQNERLLSSGTVWLAILTGALVLTEILTHLKEFQDIFSSH